MGIIEKGSGRPEDRIMNPVSGPEYDQNWSDNNHSRVFRMSGKGFALELLFRYAWIWLLSLSMFAVAGLVLGIMVDLRWLVAALMIVCIVLPLVLGFLYYYYGLRRECFVNTVSHRLIVGESGIICRLWLKGKKNDTNEEAEIANNDVCEIRFRDEFFPYESMGKFVMGKDSALVPLKKPLSGFLWIPSDAFTEPDHLSLLLRKLDAKTELIK